MFNFCGAASVSVHDYSRLMILARVAGKDHPFSDKGWSQEARSFLASELLILVVRLSTILDSFTYSSATN